MHWEARGSTAYGERLLRFERGMGPLQLPTRFFEFFSSSLLEWLTNNLKLEEVELEAMVGRRSSQLLIGADGDGEMLESLKMLTYQSSRSWNWLKAWWRKRRRLGSVRKDIKMQLHWLNRPCSVVVYSYLARGPRLFTIIKKKVCFWRKTKNVLFCHSFSFY